MPTIRPLPQAAFGAIEPGTRIGHVHLKVADLQRALDFYCGVLGFELTQRYGSQAAFVSAGGYHHHIGLNTWKSMGGSPPAPGTTGLYHLAILYPARPALADALRRLLAAGIPLDGASDHGVSEELYLRDPDENGVELYWDRPREEWPRTPGGELAMFTHSLDLQKLLAKVSQKSRPLNMGAKRRQTWTRVRERQRGRAWVQRSNREREIGVSGEIGVSPKDLTHFRPAERMAEWLGRFELSIRARSITS